MTSAFQQDPGQGDAAEPVRAYVLSPADPEPQLDFTKLMGFVRRYALQIVLCAVLGLVGGILFSYLLRPVYRAEVLLEPVSHRDASPLAASLRSSIGGIAGLAGMNLGSDETSNATALALLTSRTFLERFIVDKNLLSVFFAGLWDERRQDWTVEPTERPSLQDGYEFLIRRVVGVSADKKTGLVTLRVDWRDRNEAAAWANELVNRANTLIRDRAIREATDSLKYLNEELEQTQIVELRQALYSLTEAQIKKRMLAQTNPDFAFRVVDAARPPDADRFHRPRRAFIAVAGLLAGVLMGLAIGFVRDNRSVRSTSLTR